MDIMDKIFILYILDILDFTELQSGKMSEDILPSANRWNLKKEG